MKTVIYKGVECPVIQKPNQLGIMAIEYCGTVISIMDGDQDVTT